MAPVQSMRLFIFLVGFNVFTLGSIHPVRFVPNVVSTTIATSERTDFLKKAVQDIPSAVEVIREPWASSCNSTLIHSNGISDESETETEAFSDMDMDPAQVISKQLRLTTRFLCYLSIISGFGEICSMKSYGCFVNMVTGSTVRILVAFIEGRFDSVRVQCCAVSGYILGICLSQIIQHKRENRTDMSRHDSLMVVLRPVVALVLSFFSIPELFILFNRIAGNHPQASLTSISAMAQGAGYGLIAQTLFDSFGISVNVYVITAQYVAIAKDVMNNVLLSRTKASWAFLVNLQQERAVQILLSFLFGVIIAVFMYQFCAFLLPFQHSLTGLLYAATFIWFSRNSA